MIRFSKKGSNILDSSCEVLVNPTNCIGPMGKGLALQFKNAYPEIGERYMEQCKKGLIRPGILTLHRINPKRRILNFPTKDDWRDPSKIEYVILGLDKFVLTYREKFIESVAFPLLGTGLGGLHKQTVFDLMVEKLSPLEDIRIDIYV